MTGPASFVPEECDGYDLAIILGISPRAVRDWAARGVLVRASEPGRYVTLESIHNYLERLRGGEDMRISALTADHDTVAKNTDEGAGGKRKTRGSKK